MKMKIVHFDDIGYTVKHRLHENKCSMNFEVFKTYMDEGKRYLCGGPLIEEYEAAEQNLEAKHMFLEGFVRWDGCTNYIASEHRTNMMSHACTREELVNVGTLLGRVWDLAAEEIPSFDKDEFEDAETV